MKLATISFAILGFLSSALLVPSLTLAKKSIYAFSRIQDPESPDPDDFIKTDKIIFPFLLSKAFQTETDSSGQEEYRYTLAIGGRKLLQSLGEIVFSVQRNENSVGYSTALNIFVKGAVDSVHQDNIPRIPGLCHYQLYVDRALCGKSIPINLDHAFNLEMEIFTEGPLVDELGIIIGYPDIPHYTVWYVDTVTGRKRLIGRWFAYHSGDRELFGRNFLFTVEDLNSKNQCEKLPFSELVVYPPVANSMKKNPDGSFLNETIVGEIDDVQEFSGCVGYSTARLLEEGGPANETQKPLQIKYEYPGSE